MFPGKCIKYWADGWGQEGTRNNPQEHLARKRLGRHEESEAREARGKTRRVLHCEETSVLRKEEIDHSIDWFQEVTLNES